MRKIVERNGTVWKIPGIIERKIVKEIRRESPKFGITTTTTTTRSTFDCQGEEKIRHATIQFRTLQSAIASRRNEEIERVVGNFSCETTFFSLNYF